MSLILDLVIPGSGTIVDAFSAIFLLCGDMEDDQDACKRLFHRLKDVFNELVKMASKDQLPPSDALDKYVALVAKYLQYLEHYRKQNLVARVTKHQAMIGELKLIYEELDMLFRMLDLAGTATLMDWKQEWKAHQQIQHERMASLVGNSAVVLRELQGMRAQLEAVLTLKFEMERAERQGQETKLIKAMVVTVVRASKTTVEKLPLWYLPSDELKFEPAPFAQGSFGTVHRGIWGSGTKVVVKCFPVDDLVMDERAKQKIEAEMNLWYQFNHPHVIKMYGASHVSSPPFIVCDDASNGDLCSFLTRSDANKRQMWRLLYEAALGLEYVHKKSVVHGDLKLNNVLVSSDGQAKLSDFGMSLVLSASSVSKSRRQSTKVSGGLRWRAPECLTKKPTFASDIYSFAMCMIEAVLNEPPSAFLDDDDVRDNLKNGIIPDRPERMPDMAWEMVVSMANSDPTKRKQLIDHNLSEEEKLSSARCAACSSVLLQGGTVCSACETRPANTTQILLSLQETSCAANEAPYVSKSTSTLMAELAAGSVEEKENALLHLASRCPRDKERALMFDADGAQLLTTSARSGRTYLTQVYALECLVWAQDCGDFSGDFGELNSIRELVQEIPESLCDSLLVSLQTGIDQEKEEALVRCACIARVKKDAAKLRGAGIVEPLVALLRNRSDTQKLWLAETIANLCMETESIRAQVKEAIGPLTTLLRVGTNEQKHRAARALGNIGRDEESSKLIVEKGAIAPLTTLLKAENYAQKLCAAVALGFLAAVVANRGYYVRAGAIAPLVALLRTGTDDQKYWSAVALGNLSRDAEDCAEMVRGGAIVPLVTLLGRLLIGSTAGLVRCRVGLTLIQTLGYLTL